jgi:MFS transporter, DHA2 family, methylenomycin A resistance protein
VSSADDHLLKGSAMSLSPSRATAGTSRPDIAGQPASAPAKWLALLAACFGLFMLFVDLFIVNVALPTISRDFDAPLATVSWAVTGYVLMIGVLPLGVGRLGDILGHRSIYLLGLSLFLLASLACGLAPTIGVLIACRILQGVGAAVMTPGTLAIVTRAFPVEERGLALGIYGGISSLGLVAGPLLGGLLVNGASWRWVFFINVPVGVAAILMTLLFVSETRAELPAPKVDWAGLLVLSCGLMVLLLALTRGTADIWTIILAGLGFALLATFGLLERQVRWPLMDMALLRNPRFVGVSVSFLLFSAALFGSQPYMSLFLQNTWGLTPFQGGLAFLPAAGLIAALTPVSGLIGQWAGRHVSQVAAIGAGVMGLAFVGLTFLLGPGSTYTNTFLPVFLLRGLGIPIFSTCAQLAMLSAVPSDQVGLASGMLGSARNVGTAIGVELLGSVYIYSLHEHLRGAVPQVVRAAAEQFRSGELTAGVVSIKPAIIQGFTTLNLAAALSCFLAAVAMLAIPAKLLRPRAQQQPVSRQPIAT